ncbi:MAG: hypothetical protein HYX51_03035 [Chloroflexi bacterium]|nr:hypothetical protein [Chloroflexota bacterium]
MRRLLLALTLGVLVWTSESAVSAAPGSAERTTPASDTQTRAMHVSPEASPANKRATAGIASLERYRFKMLLRFEGPLFGDERVALEEISEGEFIAPDRHHAVCTTSAAFGGQTENDTGEVILIGDRMWMRDSDSDEWEEDDNGLGWCGLSGPPSELLAEFDIPKVVMLPATEETVNGVASIRYHLDRLTPNAEALINDVIGIEPEALTAESEVTLDYWAAKDTGWPVRIVLLARNIEGVGSAEVVLDIFDANAPDISIEAP